MSSRSIKKNFGKIDDKEEEYFDLKRVITPFSLFFLKNEEFIYDTGEKVPFSRRIPLYKSILLHEFDDSIRNAKNKI